MIKPSRIIVALDFSKKEDALRIVDKLGELVNFYKVGLELFLNEGEGILKALRKRGKKIFLDLKFHDIPNTVQKAVRATLNFQIHMLTLHTIGGVEMMKKAKEVVEETKIKENISVKLLGVTILTSFDSKMLKEIYNFPIDVLSTVKNLALLSQKAGLDGVVASAHEAATIKEHCGKDFLVVTPGIRLSESQKNDQKRTVTPQEAFSKGADYIVIGRAVTSSKNPEEILANMLR